MRVPFARFAVAGLVRRSRLRPPRRDMRKDKVSKEVAKPLVAAQTAMKAGDMATALTNVKEAQAVATRTPFDDYTINEFLGNIYIAQKGLHQRRPRL